MWRNIKALYNNYGETVVEDYYRVWIPAKHKDDFREYIECSSRFLDAVQFNNGLTSKEEAEYLIREEKLDMPEFLIRHWRKATSVLEYGSTLDRTIAFLRCENFSCRKTGYEVSDMTFDTDYHCFR